MWAKLKVLQVGLPVSMLVFQQGNQETQTNCASIEKSLIFKKLARASLLLILEREGRSERILVSSRTCSRLTARGIMRCCLKQLIFLNGVRSQKQHSSSRCLCTQSLPSEFLSWHDAQSWDRVCSQGRRSWSSCGKRPRKSTFPVALWKIAPVRCCQMAPSGPRDFSFKV